MRAFARTGATPRDGVDPRGDWDMAALVVGMVAVGLTMPRLGEGQGTNALLRASLGWFDRAPAPHRSNRGSRRPRSAEAGARRPGLKKRPARASHLGLYALLVLVPLAGWTATLSCAAR